MFGTERTIIICNVYI